MNLKKYLWLTIKTIAMTYNSFKLMCYPEKTPIWFTQAIGGYFLICAIEYGFEIAHTYLDQKLEKLKKTISDYEKSRL